MCWRVNFPELKVLQFEISLNRMRIHVDRNWDLGVKAMKFRAVVVGLLLTMSLAAPIAIGATLPTLSAQVNTFPMVNEKCSKAGQWTGFADSRYASMKTWKKIDKSGDFGQRPGSFFGIFV